MKKWNTRLMTATLATVWCLGAGSLLAQNNGGGGGGARGGRGGQGGQGGGNFDPAQMQQRMMDRYWEQLDITDAGEKTALEPLIKAVMDARMSSFGGMMGRGNRGGRPGGDTTTGNTPPRTGFGAPNPAAEALQKAIDAKASNAELKAAIAKFNEARKAKQAELEAAQAKLRAALSVLQEAKLTGSLL